MRKAFQNPKKRPLHQMTNNGNSLLQKEANKGGQKKFKLNNSGTANRQQSQRKKELDLLSIVRSHKSNYCLQEDIKALIDKKKAETE